MVVRGGARALLAAALGVGLAGALFSQPAVAATVDTTPPEPFDLVADAGDYQTGFSIASPWTSVSVSWVLTTDDTSVAAYEMAVDGLVQRVVDPDEVYATMSKHVDVPDGQHVVTVAAVDEAGNRREANQSLSVVVDKSSPTFTSFPLLLLRKGSVSMESVPVRYTWTATDIGTGLSRIRIGYGPTCCTDVAVDATSHDFTVPIGSTRNWRVFLYDGVGRTERVTRQVFVESLAAKDLKTTGSWVKRSVEGALDGDERVSTDRGDRFSFTASGRSVSWVTTRGPNRGVADVYVDKRLVATVDLKSAATLPAQAVWAYKLPIGSSHRVVVVNRSPRARNLVGVDKILVQA